MNSKTKRLLTSLLLGLGLTLSLLGLLNNPLKTLSVAHAADLQVCPSGCTYSSIQAALEDANDGDVIKVATGIYTDIHTTVVSGQTITQMVYISKNITIRGGYTITFTDPPDPVASPTILDAQGQGRVLFIIGNISPTIEGLHITGGDASGLGGSTGVPGLGNDAGGGLYVITSTVTLNNNHVYSNTARHGGGAFFYKSPNATLNDNVISENTTNNSAGGFYFRYSAGATLTANTIRNNHAGSSGGQQTAGGARFEDSDNVTLISNIISGNHADNQYGGICFTSGSDNVTLINNSIVGNSAGIPGSGFVNSEGGGLSFISSTDVNLIGNTIRDNSSTTFGGGLYLEQSELVMLNNVIADNRIMTTTILIGSGSGLYIAGASPRLLHTTIVDNSGGDGSGIYVTESGLTFSNVAMTNTILVSHVVGIAVSPGNTATLEATLWGSGSWANDNDWAGAGTIITGTVNVYGDPKFVDPKNGDYHIAKGSAAIDSGVTTGITTDIDGDLRPLDGDLDGTAITDLGADEFGFRVNVPIIFKGF